MILAGLLILCLLRKEIHSGNLCFVRLPRSYTSNTYVSLFCMYLDEMFSCPLYVEIQKPFRISLRVIGSFQRNHLSKSLCCLEHSE